MKLNSLHCHTLLLFQYLCNIFSSELPFPAYTFPLVNNDKNVGVSNTTVCVFSVVSCDMKSYYMISVCGK